jgi:hypothetical protein
MAGQFKAWTIVEDPLFSAQKNAINPDARRMDEVLDGIMWGLGENPREGFPVPGHRLWVIKTDLFPGAPRVRVWYKIDDETQTVRLLSIERVEGED